MTDVTPAVNRAVAAAQTLPQLVSNLSEVAPELAQQLETKPLAASRSPWGTLAVAAVSYLSAAYGLGLDSTSSSLIGGLGVLAGSYAMRAITRQPIAGITSTPAPAAS